ncbi:MAG: hypothetical protein IJN10_09675 [Firmicutes bacterium]|nr:hypothetical protein [Bacillota bacterium]
MKKHCIMLILAICLSLCACKSGTAEAPPECLDVRIVAGKIETGMTAKDVLVEVTIDNQPVACKVELTCFTNVGYYDMAEDEQVPENFFGRLNVFYSLPKGIDVDHINVSMECDGGEYDGTGSYSSDEEGNEVAWSHAIYGEEPKAEDSKVEDSKIEDPKAENSKVENSKAEDSKIQDFETENSKTEDSKSEEVKVEEPVHEHNWVIDAAQSSPASCTTDGYQVYVCECGDTFQEAIPATGHSFIEDPSQSKSASCIETGYKTYVCSCGETQRESIPTIGHSLKTTSDTSPSCTDAGYLIQTCSYCGAGFINEKPATGHSWSEWTYFSGRYHERTCSKCGETEQANHNIPSNSVTCSDCGYDIIN